MSLMSKVTLASASLFAVGMISYVHYKQYYDRQQLHEGVLNDIERRQRRKIENLFNLQKQIEFTKEVEKRQNSSDVT